MTPNESAQRPELWIDLPDALDQARSRAASPQSAEHLVQFIEKGYTIFKAAVPATMADRIVADAHAVKLRPGQYVSRRQGKYVNPESIAELGIGDRILDLYGISEPARSAIFGGPVAELLHAIFGEPAIAMQALYFEFGSQQAIHQDTAYVVSKKPLHLVASWIALEDVGQGTGELIYYPGSHRFTPYLFGGGSKSWNQKQHGPEVHKEFLAQLHAQAKERGLQIERFLPRKGDVLVWHADLAHGGARITQKHSRRALVTHFCPISVKPNYSDLTPANYFELKDASGHYFSSRHYDLRPLAEGRQSVLFYDGGVRKRAG